MAKMTRILHRSTFLRIGDGVFSASVTLPVGKKIVKVTYYHFGTRSPYSSLRIMRVKTGETPEKLGYKCSTDASSTPVPVDVPITGDPVIRGGYRYYFLASVNSSGFFEGVKIDYLE